MFILEETLATLKKLTVPERWSEECVAKRNEIKEVPKSKRALFAWQIDFEGSLAMGNLTPLCSYWKCDAQNRVSWYIKSTLETNL